MRTARPPAPRRARPVRPARTATLRPGWWALLRSVDVGVAYGLLTLGTALLVFRLPGEASSRLVLGASTNLVNLRSAPVRVLLVSAFVVPSPWSLWVLPVLVWAYGTAQRWLGRGATVLVGLLGHVFATLLVGVLLAAGIARRELDRSLAREPDVGVSYGLATVLGLLVLRLEPGRTRRTVALVGTGALLLRLAVGETFTDLGHLVAWGTGLGVGLVGERMVQAAAPPGVTPGSP